MQTINDLLNSLEGRRYLEAHNITTSQVTFVANLKAPRNPVLQQYLGVGGQKPVFAFQQIYVDITQSMLDRFGLLEDLTGFDSLAPFFLWIDTDRVGSDKVTTRIYWPHWGKVQSIPICPHAVKDIESRFVKMDPDRLDAALGKLGSYLVQTVPGKGARSAANRKFNRLKDIFLENHFRKLSGFNHTVSSFLLKEYTGLDPVSVFVSDLVNEGLLTAEIEAVLNHLDGVIEAFNQAREGLIRLNINPVVKPLAENYLPLNYTCPNCRRRLRLVRENKDGDQYAAAACRCGETPRFYLGRQCLAVSELAHTHRWSPDISLAFFMNDLVSGFVGGGSSGVYFGLLMKAALEQALGKQRVPVLLPEKPVKPREQFDRLIYRYLTEAEFPVRNPEVAR